MTNHSANDSGSVAQRVIAYFEANPQAELGSAALCEILRLEPTNLSSLLRSARLSGAIAARKIGVAYWWSKGTGQAAAASPQAENTQALQDDTQAADAFCFSLHSDGEMIIQGATQTDDGGIQLTV